MEIIFKPIVVRISLIYQSIFFLAIIFTNIETDYFTRIIAKKSNATINILTSYIII